MGNMNSSLLHLSTARGFSQQLPLGVIPFCSATHQFAVQHIRGANEPHTKANLVHSMQCGLQRLRSSLQTYWHLCRAVYVAGAVAMKVV